MSGTPWVLSLVHNRYIFAVPDEAILQGDAKLNFSPTYYSVVAENAIKPLVFMHHEAMSIFSEPRNVLKLVYFWVFHKICSV